MSTLSRRLALCLSFLAALCSTVVIAAPAHASISGISATNDADEITYQFSYTGTQKFVRAFIDPNPEKPNTGFTGTPGTPGYLDGIGADYLIENGSLFKYTGSGGGDWQWALVRPATYSNNGSLVKWMIWRYDIGETETPNTTDLVFQTEDAASPPVVESSKKYTHTFADFPASQNFGNPERGFYYHKGDCDKTPFDKATLERYRVNENVTLVMCIFYLDGFQNTPTLSEEVKTKLKQRLDTARAAGVKVILRFAYTQDTAGNDAPKDIVIGHIDQLADILRDNADVISVVQGGFIGAWGEWYYTKNFGDQGNVTDADWANRKAVVDHLLSVVPDSRMVQLRTPFFKQKMYSTSPVSESDAYNGSALSRLGHHNDCFVSSPDDFGTYRDTSTEYPYLHSDTQYVAMGGETCAPDPPRSDCATTMDELAQFHWSFLNTDYEPNVVSGWHFNGCYSEIFKKLGYRFSLENEDFSPSVDPGSPLHAHFTVKNVGYSAPFNPRKVFIVLRNDSSGQTYRLAVNQDPRRWKPGSTTVDENVTVPGNVPGGVYSILLELPDPMLLDRPEYSIRLVADQNTSWEAEKGLNDLHQKVNVGHVIRVPNLVGLKEPVAVSTLRDNGLDVGEISHITVHNRDDADSVMSHSPKAGESVPPGTKVKLVLGLWDGSNS